ncbi:lysophospholipid acyltransferase family protein [Propionivibrio sp.]|uniref:lysophospholipid acyltransferase family protein n=1 Tax=Propionivibrio sp. TaxID=2212460 RepID=UPI00272E68A6|nr:lysophospholipid acyltransferase family protein [Propionivibrio sp.]
MSAPSPTPYLLRGLRCVRLALHLLWLGLGAAVIYPRVSTERQLALRQRWSHQILTILGIRLDAEATDAPPGCLIVANHISWLDIFAINALRPSAFISKEEVRHWPFIGWLSARNDTIFLNRGSRRHARAINEEIDARLNAGRDVAIFPEGRTTDGRRVLEFHAALLQPAIETGRPLLPIAIAYLDAEGHPSSAPSFATTSLPQCFAAILACRALTARLNPLPIITTAERSRRDVSREAHAAISTRLGFPPARTEPEIPPDPPA